MHYTSEQITALIDARRFGANSDKNIDWLLTDSRSLAFPEATLFFALRSQRNDGHKYVADLYRRGVRDFVVSALPDDYASRFPAATFYVVADPLKALQHLAECHRRRFDIPVVGNGKTIVKEWLYQLLSPQLVVTRSPRSYNSQVGVPLSVCLLNTQTQLGIFEAGISQPGEMSALRPIIQPRIGVMTNIGQAHQENFTSHEEKCAEKLSLFKDADVLIYDADDPVVAEGVRQASFAGDQLAWSRTKDEGPLVIRKVAHESERTHITYAYLQQESDFFIPFTDEASVQNAIHCLAVCLYLHVDAAVIAQRMARLEPVAMRLEVKQGVRGCILINDSYNSDVNSLDIALDFMQRRPDRVGMRKTLILSDISQSGMPREQLYAQVAEMVNRRGVDRLIGVGPDLSAMQDLFKIDAVFYPTTKALLESGKIGRLRNEMVLLKGARTYNFEALTELLSLKVHETILEVDLAAIAANLNYFRSFMRPETKIACMVKASAYGAGSVEIAKTLQDRGVDYLAVAVADEGADLRKAGITSNIIIMNPEMSSFNTLFAYDLEPEVYDFSLLEALIRAAKQQGITNFPIHIKLDTGMKRLGFDPLRDMPALIDRLHHQAALIPRSVFSHFVGSDSPAFDAFSDHQFELFDKASQQLQAAFPHKILRHICNSAGIERFPQRHLDMVRLGLGLYGVDPIDNHIINNVTTLKTTILQIRDVQAGETVGYGRKGVLERNSRIAAIPIGYADGLNRHLGNRRAYCLVNGRKAYYVGNICMDVCMIDVTDIPCKEGDSVEVFGPHLPITVLSDALETIPYEILTSVSNRVKRIYYQE